MAYQGEMRGRMGMTFAIMPFWRKIDASNLSIHEVDVLRIVFSNAPIEAKR